MRSHCVFNSLAFLESPWKQRLQIQPFDCIHSFLCGDEPYPRLLFRWVSAVGEHECIVCPYHGWAFDKDGVLRDVPAAENADEWPKKPLVQSYPVEEKV